MSNIKTIKHEHVVHMNIYVHVIYISLMLIFIYFNASRHTEIDVICDEKINKSKTVT